MKCNIYLLFTGLHCQQCAQGVLLSIPLAHCPALRTMLWWRLCSMTFLRLNLKTCGRRLPFLYQNILHLVLLTLVMARHLTSHPCSHRRALCPLITTDLEFQWFLSLERPGDPCFCHGLEEKNSVYCPGQKIYMEMNG